MILLEAMAAETPIVASDLPGYRNVIGAGDQDALLVPPGDAAALAAALRRVLERPRRWPPRWPPPATSGPPTFSMDRLAERYLELYRSAIAGVRSRMMRAP